MWLGKAKQSQLRFNCIEIRKCHDLCDFNVFMFTM